MSIANCGSDEKEKYSGGSAGDQTGKEYQVRSWYSRPWLCVLRFPDTTVGQKLATKAKNAANNDNIGYDQGQRLTFYNALKAADWKPKNIKTKCEADCSSSTAALVIAVGHALNLAKLQKVNPSCTTSNLRAALKAAGFEVLTDPKYLTSDDYLLPGDILLKDGSHVAINLTTGSKATATTSSGTKKKIPTLASAPPNLQFGTIGKEVRYLQENLNYLGIKGKDGKALTVDGAFGKNTEFALRVFQKKCGLVVDGVYGYKSKAKMKSLLI